ncbi:MAG TPA: DUF454 family protein [Thermoanaerobaculia bacterium]|nr:DUF454 family protein [Thermoanaerobaculia bacterium]HTQ11381.1 DUF454 family protein [Fimbriimonadaceae bacterium]
MRQAHPAAGRSSGPLTPVQRKHPIPKRRRRQRRGKAWNLGMGIFFFIVGVIGILIPVMPQVPFFIMSLLFFSLVFPPIRRRIRRFLHGHPRVAHAYKRWRDKARKKRQAIIRREKELFAHLRHHGEV